MPTIETSLQVLTEIAGDFAGTVRDTSISEYANYRDFIRSAQQDQR